MNYKRGQSSIEFFILIGAILFFFVAFLFAIYANINDKYSERLNLEVQETALGVVDEINLAYKASDGYQRDFSLPIEVANRAYTINITSGLVYLHTKDGKFSLAYPVQNVTGQPQIGDNKIEKRNGEVRLNS